MISANSARGPALALICLNLLLGLVGGCRDTVTAPGVDLPYFPLDVGNHWTYAPEISELGGPFDWEVTERAGDTVSLQRPPGGSHPGPVTLLDGPWAVRLYLGEGEFALLRRFRAGSSWIRRDPWECDDGSSWVAVEEAGSIQTPAGTFSNTLRLERRSTANCSDAGTTYEWWAPGVGLVQWVELNFYAGGPLIYHLVDYSVG